ncbi:MAG: hypothetical protein ACK55I_15010, partial [bacterium]
MAQAADQGANGGERLTQFMGGVGGERDQPFNLPLHGLQGGGHHPLAAGEGHQGGQEGTDQEAMAQSAELGLRAGRGHG